MTKVNDWLETIPSQATRKSYINGIKTFEKYNKKGVDNLIGTKGAGRIVEKFFVWLRETGYSQNTARVKTNAVIQFLKYFDTPVKYRKSLGIYRSEIAIDHILQTSEVHQMFSVANLREKIILEVFILGLRARDASQLEWKVFDTQNQEAPIPITIRTHKEGINCYTFISQEFKELLAKYILNLDKNNKYLLQTKRKGHLDAESLNWTLKNLAERANLKSKDKLHWHLGRKLVMRTSAQLGINQWNCKMLVGRSIPKDIETYINGIQLKEDFEKLHNVLRLSRDQDDHGTEDLKKALMRVEEENAIFKTRIDELQKHVADIKQRVVGKDNTITELSRNVDDLKLTVSKFIEGKDNEAFQNAFGYIENHAGKLEAIVQELQDRLDKLEGKSTMEESIAKLDTLAKRKAALERNRKLKNRLLKKNVRV